MLGWGGNTGWGRDMRTARSTVWVASALVGLAIGAYAKTEFPVLYLPFDEGAGNIARDAAGGRYKAELSGNVKWIDGKPGYDKAAQFGPDAWGVVDVGRDFQFKKSFTLMVWARIDGDLGDQQMGIEKGAAWGPGEYSLLPDFEDAVLVQAHDLPDGCDDEIRAGDVRDGKWHHIAGTFDGLVLRAYVDGEERQNLDCPGDLLTNADPIFIASRAGKERWTDGAYDELRIYDRALTAKEVREAMTPGLAVQPANSLAAIWAELRTQR